MPQQRLGHRTDIAISKHFSFAAFLLLVPMLFAVADPVRARHTEGEVHAYLMLRDTSGRLLGTADAVNVPAGKAWEFRLTIRFLDGSLDDDTATYTQARLFRLLTDHHVQKGPSFPTPTDVTIDRAKGNVTWHQVTSGRDEVKTEHMDLPDDLGNGIMPMLLQNMARGSGESKVGYVVSTPKPRLVTMAIHNDGPAPYRIGPVRRSATKYRLHVELGGIAGVVAPILGKEPPDLAAWVSSGDAPTFLKLYGFLYQGGPLWRLELASPQW